MVICLGGVSVKPRFSTYFKGDLLMWRNGSHLKQYSVTIPTDITQEVVMHYKVMHKNASFSLFIVGDGHSETC